MEAAAPVPPSPSKLVLVTGATGFIATHVIVQLQQKGYKVRGTVRSLTKDPKLIEQLRSLCPGAAHPLELVEADLLKADGWDAAAAGCDFVCHIAAHVALTAPDPQEDIVKPSLMGLKYVFEAARKAKTVKKIVFTSSVAAIAHSGAPKLYSEMDWNTTSNILSNPYNYAKTLAEKSAWEFVRSLPEVQTAGEKIDLDVINPTLVLGPPLTKQATSSLEVPLRMLKGEMPLAPQMGWGMVDVRDVARAHVLAMERQGGDHRFVLSNKSMWVLELASEMSRQFPQYPLPSSTAPNFLVYVGALFDPKLKFAFLNDNLGTFMTVDNSKSKTMLGVEYTPFETTVKDTVEGLVRVGLLEKK